MKPPKGPFWAWTDIGDGLKWLLCIVARGDDDGKPMIKYMTEDFEDFWYDDDWDSDDIKVIKTPQPREAV